MKTGAVVVAVLVVLVGAVFAGQGLGYIQVAGSIMTGDIKWFWIGGAMVVLGLAVLGFTFLRRTKPA